MAPRVFKSKHRECLVLLPSGEEISCDITDSITGFRLLDIVCEKLNIESEKHYFGFKYVHKKDGKYSWLNLKKVVGKKLKTSNYHVEFHVQYWPSTPFTVKQDIVRYQMLLETRTKILNGELSTTLPIQALLTSCLIQAEIGDWKNTPEYSQTFDDEESFKFFPNQPTEFADQVKLFHERLVGTTQDEAELMYLESARRLILHGMEMHAALDDNQVSIILGINCAGISVLQNGFMLNRLLWEQVVKLKRHKHTLFVGLKLGEEDDNVVKVGFHSTTHLDLKRLYRCCCGYWDLSRKRESGFSGKTSVPFTRVDSKRFMKFKLSKQKPATVSEPESKSSDQTTATPENCEEDGVDDKAVEQETKGGVPLLKDIAAAKIPVDTAVSENVIAPDESKDNEHLQQEGLDDEKGADVKKTELKDNLKSEQPVDVKVDPEKLPTGPTKVDRELQRESVILEVWKEDEKFDIQENDDDIIQEEQEENVETDTNKDNDVDQVNSQIEEEEQQDVDKKSEHDGDHTRVDDGHISNDDSPLPVIESTGNEDDFENINDVNKSSDDGEESDEDSQSQAKEFSRIEDDFENINDVDVQQGDDDEHDESTGEGEKSIDDIQANEDDFENINGVDVPQECNDDRKDESVNKEFDEDSQGYADYPIDNSESDPNETDDEDEEYIDIVVEETKQPDPTEDEVPRPLYRSSYIEDVEEEESDGTASSDDNEDSQRGVEVLSDSDVGEEDDMVNIDPILAPDQTPKNAVNGDVDCHDQEEEWDDDDLLVVEAIIEKLDNEANTKKDAALEGSVKVIVNGVHDTDNQHRHSFHEWEGLMSRSFNKSYSEYDERLMSTVSNMSEVSRMSEQELLESLDLDTVLVETMEYTTEDIDPETSNVCVTTHTYFTEIESSQSMME